MRNSPLNRLLSVFVVLALLVQMMPVQSLAATTDAPITGAAAQTTAVPVSETADPVTIIGEAEHLRTETEKHFRLSDGSFIAVNYGGPVHYEDSNGEWQDIDNTLTAHNGTYRAFNGNTTTVFSADLSTGQLLTSEYGGVSVGMGLRKPSLSDSQLQTESITSETVQFFNTEVVADISTEMPAQLAGAITGERWKPEEVIPQGLYSEVLYEDVYPGIDLSYALYGYDIKEQIIVKEPQSSYTYQFSLSLDGLTAALQEDGSVLLSRADGTVAYTIPAPYMADSLGEVSLDVTYSLSQTADGTVLTVSADEEWINAKERAFPVYIDPTLQVQNNASGKDIYSIYVTQGSPSTVRGFTQWIYMGYSSSSSKEYRIFMYFNTMPQIPAGNVVVDASLNLYMRDYDYVNCANLGVGLYEVTDPLPSNRSDYYNWIYYMTWKNQPAYDTSNMLDYAILNEAGIGQYHSWDMTELVKQWYIEDTENRTIAMAITEGERAYGTYYCAIPVFLAWASSIPPLLIVSYRSNTGIEPYYTYNTLGAGNAGTAYISDATGQLKAAKGLVSYASTVSPFSAGLVYNSDYFASDASAATYPAVELGTDMRMGAGWTLDLIQKVEPVTIGTIDYLKYRDGDGTDHYFCKDSDKDSTGKYYYDEDGLGLKLRSTGTNAYEMTDDHGNKWSFTNNFLTSTTDSNGNQYLISYTNDRITSVSQKNKGKSAIPVADFTWTDGWLTAVTDAAGNSYTLSYTDNTLTAISQGSTVLAQYTYDGHRLSGMTDAESDDSLVFGYSDFGRISSYREVADTTTGVQVDVSYSQRHSKTTYRDYGNDRQPGTTDDLFTHYLFDSADRTVNAYTTNYDGTKILGATNAVYSANSGTDKTNNRTLRSASIGVAARQLLQNSSFEAESPAWTLSGTGTVAEGNARTGVKHFSAALSGTQSASAAIATPSLTAGQSYVASAYVNTAQLTAFEGQGVYLKLTAPGGSVTCGEAVNYATSAAVDDGWVRICAPFTASESGVYTLSVEGSGVTGSFYADDLQLETGEAPSTHNMLENGTMQFSDRGWTLTNAAYTTGIGTNSTDTDAAALTVTGGHLKESKASQTVLVGLPGTQTYVLSGWVKANAVRDNLQSTDDPATDTYKQCGLRAILTYSDGETEYHYTAFHADVSDWQFASLTIVPKESAKTVASITVECAYERNANTAHFDDIALTREIAQTMTYDADGNLVSSDSTGLNEDTNTYENGNLIQTVTGGNGTFTYTYDTQYTHRLTEVSNGLIKQSYGYDGVGNATSTTLTDAEETLTVASSATYTADGNRISSVTDGTGATTTYAYGTDNSVMWGLPTAVTNAKNVTATTEYDSYGRVTETGIANTAHIQYDYDNGTVSSITRKDSQDIAQTYGFTYDAFGNTTSVKVGSVTLAAYTYAANNGLLQTQTYGNGDTVSYTYDDLGRAKTVTYADGRVVTYRYNGEGQLWSATETGGSAPATYLYSYDSLGRLISGEMKNSSGTLLRTSQGYDANNRLLSQGWQMGSTAYSESYTYNEADGSLNTMTTGDGSTLTMGYDALRRLASINAGIYTASHTYRSLPNGNTTMQVAGLQYTGLADSLSFGYTYDEVGNLATYTENGTTQTYTYDDQGQLLTATDGTTTYTYTYDTVGNILTASDGVTTHTYSYTDAQWQDLLTAFDGQAIAYQGQTYDAETGTVTGTAVSGNPVSYYNGTRWSFGWTNSRQLITATDGDADLSYTYNADGLRMTKTVDGITHTYLYAGGKLLRETYGTTTLDFFYGSNGTPFALKVNGTVYYYITNLQGDVLRLVDASGNTVASYSYDPYGKVLTATGTLANTNPLRYRGYYYDTETGLYYVSSRYYDPEIGRWISFDVILVVDGSTLLGYNLFSYCCNTPINGIDIDGNWPEWIKDAVKWVATNIVKPVVKYVQKVSSKRDSTYSLGLNVSGTPSAFMFNLQSGIAIDTKGNVAIQDSQAGGLTGGDPGISVSVFLTGTNAPNIDKLEGPGYQIGGSFVVPVEGVPLVVAGDYNIIPDSDSGVGYQGFTINFGLGTPGREFHVEWGETKTRKATRFNIYDVAAKAYSKIMGW